MPIYTSVNRGGRQEVIHRIYITAVFTRSYNEIFCFVEFLLEGMKIVREIEELEITSLKVVEVKRIYCLNIAILLLFSASLFAQTPEQKKLLDEYLKEKSGPAKSINKVQPTHVDIFDNKQIKVPPRADKGVGEAKGDRETRPPRLKRFGLELFAHPPESFVASTEVPVPPDYVLGPGDHIIVNLWGHADLSLELVIDREGKVFIPKAGELVLWGLTLGQAERRIKNVLSTIYSDFKMNVILGKIRSITVYVSGEAVRPGAYTVNSLYTLFNTLYLAGGPTEKGSMRDIRLVRANKIVKRVDLYSLLIDGNGEDVRLESNDIIFIPVVGPLVTVKGDVRRPGIYELAGGERVVDAIALAGGVRSSAYLGSVELYRYTDNKKRVLLTLDLSDSSKTARNNLALRDGDEITIRSVSKLTEQVVFLYGEIKYPGEYQYKPGMRVTDLVSKDILLPHAYLKRAFLTRTFKDNSKKVYPLDLRRILQYSPDGFEGEGAVSGEQVVPFDPQDEDTTVLTRNIELRPWDRLDVFSYDRMKEKLTINIDGEVRMPGRYDYAEDMTLSDLVYLAGGPKRSAYLLHAEIARMDVDTMRVSRVFRVDLRRALSKPHSRFDPVLEPSDAVFIREIPNYQDHKKVWVGGEILFPGTYVLDSDSESLKEVIARAGGFTRDAFLPGAVLMRKGIAKDLEERDVLSVISSLQRVYRDSSGVIDKRVLPIEVNSDRMNRIIIDLPKIMSGDDDSDVVLQDGDRFYVPRKPSGISVIGAVASSGTIMFKEGKKARYYIDKAGGFTRRSSKGDTRIIKPNGMVVKKRVMSHRVELGDVIVVPEKVEKDRNWLKVFQTSMSIIASALTTVYVVTKL